MSEIKAAEINIDQIMDLVDKELEIDVTKLDYESTRQVKIFSIIQRLYVKETRKLEKVGIQLEATKAYRRRYYSGKLSPEVYKNEPLREVPLKGDIDELLKIDAKVLEVRLLLGEQERLVKYLEDAKKQLSDRGYQLRLALDFQKFQMGMN